MSKIKLAFFDMEGTIFKKAIKLEDTTVAPSAWVAIAKHLGSEAREEEQQTQKKWNSGEYSNYIEWMEETIAIHKKYGLKRDDFNEILDRIVFMTGTNNVFETLRDNNIPTALISGGFKYQANRAQTLLLIDHVFVACEYFWNDDGKLFHWNLLPGDYNGKIDFMKLLIREYQLDSHDCAFIGDGINDCNIAKEVGLSIAFNAAPELQKVSTYAVNQEEGQEDLRAIIPYLGF